MSAPKRVPEALTVEAATHDGRGIAHVDGKVVFVSGGLPGERVLALRRARRRGFDEARTLEVLEPAAGRTEPRCAHYGTCGGCTLQHADPATQVALKQQTLADSLARIGRVAPAEWFAPITGPSWRYRRRARLSCRYAERRQRVVVGFREGGAGGQLVDLSTCEVLADPVAGLIGPLGRLLGGLSVARHIAQVEVAVADNVTVLVLRHLAPLAAADFAALRAFAAEWRVAFELQPGGPASAAPLDAGAATPVYSLPEFDLELEFRATDFIQVNGPVNRALVGRAVELLAPAAGDSVLDLFCGLGNFTLPLARRAGRVTGVEGDAALVARARANAARNGIDNATFHVADLFAPPGKTAWATARHDGLLLDPPRAGAREILARVPAWRPARIVYVSCHPGTLARDAGVLVGEYGYRLAGAGVVDMFPHTAHAESIALFER